MKLLTFLGTGRYQPVWYRLGKEEFETEYVAEALHNFLKPEEVVVFVTREAMETHGRELEKRIPARFVPIEVPKKQEDVWGIFEAMVESVGEGESIALDITHAFRHIPFLAFPAMLYLVEMKGVSVEGVYYGAFEARSEENGKTVAPIFELSGLLEAIEWLYGLRDLKRYGRAEGLSDAIRKTNARIYRQGTGEKPRVLSRYSTALRNISTLLHLNQVPEFMETVARAGRDFGSFREEAVRFLPPLRYSLGEVERLMSFGCSSGYCLRESVGLVEYMLEKGLVANALELERELIVNIVLAKLGVEDYLSRENRVKAERTLGWFAGRVRGEKGLEKTDWADELENWEGSEELARAWLRIGEVRNAIAHAGMKPRRDRPQPKSIIKSAVEVLETLKGIVETLGEGHADKG